MLISCGQNEQNNFSKVAYRWFVRNVRFMAGRRQDPSCLEGRHINISPAPEAQFTGQEVVITGNLFLAYLLTSSANHIILTIA